MSQSKINRIRVHASVASSVDGYIDDVSSQRLILSSQEDLAEIQQLRSKCDAIFVGAQTIRKDNPSLILRDSLLIDARIRRGQSPQLTKVTVTTSGNLSPECQFFQAGDGAKWVICPESLSIQLKQKLNPFAEIVSIPKKEIDAKTIVDALEERGIKDLFLEGGTSILTQFLLEDQIDTLRLAIAPFFVGEINAPRIVGPGRFPFNKNKRMILNQVSQLGNTAVLNYKLKP